MKRAVDYAHLVGKYIRMECDDLDEPTRSHGMECLVVGVFDMTNAEGRPSVVIVGDYGMTYTIAWDRQDDWHFAVFDTEANMHNFSKYGAAIPQTFGMSRRRKVEQ